MKISQLKISQWVVLIYGLLILVGGMIGFAKAHSAPSLIMGISFSIVIFLSAWLMFKGNKLGNTIAMVCSGLLTLFFAYRFFLTEKFMPAGLMVILSLIVLSFLLRSQASLKSE